LNTMSQEIDYLILIYEILILHRGLEEQLKYYHHFENAGE